MHLEDRGEKRLITPAVSGSHKHCHANGVSLAPAVVLGTEADNRAPNGLSHSARISTTSSTPSPAAPLVTTSTTPTQQREGGGGGLWANAARDGVNALDRTPQSRVGNGKPRKHLSPGTACRVAPRARGGGGGEKASPSTP